MYNVSGLESEDVREWVFSYNWGYVSQTIDLEKEGVSAELLDQTKPPISTSVWICSNPVAGCVFSFAVRLLMKTKTHEPLDIHEVKPNSNTELEILSTRKELERYEDTIDSFTYGRRVGQYNALTWKKIGHTFTQYPDGVRYIQVTFGGKDTCYWDGHYGGTAAAPCIAINSPM